MEGSSPFGSQFSVLSAMKTQRGSLTLTAVIFPPRHRRADNLHMTMIRRRRPILSAILTVLFVGYASGETPKDNRSEVSQSEYEIFSAFIEKSFVGKAGAERVDFPVSQIIIADRTAFDETEIVEEMSWKQVRQFLRKEVPSLKSATIDDFRQTNQSQAALQQQFSLPLPYQLVAESTFESIFHDDSGWWPQFYVHYPGAQGFLTLSRVGFSSDGQQAMFYVANHCGGKCGSWSFVVAQKHGPKWSIVKEVVYGAA